MCDYLLEGEEVIIDLEIFLQNMTYEKCYKIDVLIFLIYLKLLLKYSFGYYFKKKNQFNRCKKLFGEIEIFLSKQILGFFEKSEYSVQNELDDIDKEIENLLNSNLFGNIGEMREFFNLLTDKLENGEDIPFEELFSEDDEDITLRAILENIFNFKGRKLMLHFMTVNGTFENIIRDMFIAKQFQYYLKETM